MIYNRDERWCIHCVCEYTPEHEKCCGVCADRRLANRKKETRAARLMRWLLNAVLGDES